jgi:hypothetical protein
MWEGTERDYQRFEVKLIDFLCEQGWDHIELSRDSCPDLRAKVRNKLKRDKDGFLQDPVVVKIVLK